MSISSFIKKYLDGKSLKARALSGGMWLGAGGGVEQGLRLLRNMILARILAPEAFGLMAIILAVNAAFESFTQIGIKEAIIQNPKAEENTYLNGAWWLSFARAAGLCVLGVVVSPWIADFYNISKDIGILQLSFLGILFNGALSARAYIALKKMEYKKWVFISSGGGICGITTAIVLSFFLHNVWALVIGFIVEAIARCLLSFIICPFVPRFIFSQEHSKALFKYARGMFGLPILTFIFTQSDIFVVGKLFPKYELGLYSLAISLAQIPLSVITTLINPILMPAFSEKQNDKQWINQTILKSTGLIILLGMPLVFFVALYGKDLLSIIYGNQYGTMAIPFAILFSSAFMRACSVPIANVYLAIGRPELHRLFTGIRAILIILFIYPAIKWLGLTGAAIAGFLSMFLSYFFQVWQIRNLTNLDVRQYGTIFLQALSISLLVGLFWLFTYNLLPSKPIINILQGLIGCLLCYGITIVFFKRKKAGEAFNLN